MPGRSRTVQRIGTLLIAGLLLFGFAACGDSKDDVDDAVDSAREKAEDVAGAVTARTAAEAVRAALQAEDLAPNQTVRDVTVLQEAVKDIPGDPKVTGIDDADGDGKDDDGKVQVVVGDQTACVAVEDNGDISVSSDSC
jgi:hypothetical protein